MQTVRWAVKQELHCLLKRHGRLLPPRPPPAPPLPLDTLLEALLRVSRLVPTSTDGGPQAASCIDLTVWSSAQQAFLRKLKGNLSSYIVPFTR